MSALTTVDTLATSVLDSFISNTFATTFMNILLIRSSVFADTKWLQECVCDGGIDTRFIS